MEALTSSDIGDIWDGGACGGACSVISPLSTRADAAVHGPSDFHSARPAVLCCLESGSSGFPKPVVTSWTCWTRQLDRRARVVCPTLGHVSRPTLRACRQEPPEGQQDYLANARLSVTQLRLRSSVSTLVFGMLQHSCAPKWRPNCHLRSRHTVRLQELSDLV